MPYKELQEFDASPDQDAAVAAIVAASGDPSQTNGAFLLAILVGIINDYVIQQKRTSIDALVASLTDPSVSVADVQQATDAAKAAIPVKTDPPIGPLPPVVVPLP